MQGDVVIMSDVDSLCTATITLAKVTRHDSTSTCVIPLAVGSKFSNGKNNNRIRDRHTKPYLFTCESYLLNDTTWKIQVEDYTQLRSCNPKNLIRVPCLCSRGPSNYIVDLTNEFISAVVNAIIKTRSLGRTADVAQHPVIVLRNQGITRQNLDMTRGTTILEQLSHTTLGRHCKLGPRHEPTGGWRGKVLAVSDGSDKRNRGTAGYVAESRTRVWSSSLKISLPRQGKLSSYRAEGGGLLLMLLSLYYSIEHITRPACVVR